MERKPWVGGNWKCNGTKDSITTLCKEFEQAKFNPAMIDVVICPTFLHIPLVQNSLKRGFIVAAQNMSKTGNGAFTGEVSHAMLKDFGISWTLIGHSERRQYYGETDDVVAAKVEVAQNEGLYAAICIGELLKERQEGKTVAVLQRQMEAVIPKIKDWSRVVVAYEPVWAIGTRVVATTEQAQEAHHEIRTMIRRAAGDTIANESRIAYGGSVTPEN
eukprot:Platyproteum_vivax@DN11312_c0_g1_i1.p1